MSREQAQIRMNEMDSLMEAAEMVVQTFTDAACVQVSTLSLIIAKRIGTSQTEATIKLGEKGFNNLIHDIKIWISRVPELSAKKIQDGDLWAHRPQKISVDGAVSLGIHIPGTPNGSDPVTYGIYQVLSDLGGILTSHGFNTNDIGAFYDRQKLPHLGILLRFAWSNEMKELFAAYQQILDAIAKLRRRNPPKENSDVVLREQATLMWSAV